jgi:hypothetical protein
METNTYSEMFIANQYSGMFNLSGDFWDHLLDLQYDAKPQDLEYETIVDIKMMLISL